MRKIFVYIVVFIAVCLIVLDFIGRVDTAMKVLALLENVLDFSRTHGDLIRLINLALLIAIVVVAIWPWLCRRLLRWVEGSPFVAFTFNNKQEPWVTFVTGYNAHRVSLKVEPNSRLTNANGYVRAFRKWDGKNWGACLIHDTRTILGWPHDQETWVPRTITTQGDLLIVFLCSKSDGYLQLMTNVTYEYIKPLKKIEQGRYQLQVEFDAKELTSTYVVLLEMEWTGSIENFSMKIVSQS